MLEPWASVRGRWLEAAGKSDASKVSVAEPVIQAAIVAELKRGNFLPLVLRDVVIDVPGLGEATVRVLADALRIGTAADHVRVNVSARTSQQLLDLLGLEQTTAKVEDAAWQQADHRLEPIVVQDEKQRARSDLAAMEIHSAKIGVKLAAAGALPGDLVRGGGNKVWAASHAVTKTQAANYGSPTTAPAGADGKRPWPAATPMGDRVWQPLPLLNKHDKGHADYSQIAYGMARDVRIVLDGSGTEITMPAAEVAAHPKFWPFLSHEGPLSLHDPWLPYCDPLEAGGGCTSGVEPQPPPAFDGWRWIRRRLFPFIGLGTLFGVLTWKSK